jgi:hypothetical protein
VHQQVAQTEEHGQERGHKGAGGDHRPGQARKDPRVLVTQVVLAGLDPVFGKDVLIGDEVGRLGQALARDLVLLDLAMHSEHKVYPGK